MRRPKSATPTKRHRAPHSISPPRTPKDLAVLATDDQDVVVLSFRVPDSNDSDLRRAGGDDLSWARANGPGRAITANAASMVRVVLIDNPC